MKKAVSLLICTAMLIGLFTVPVYAEETAQPSIVGDYIYEQDFNDATALSEMTDLSLSDESAFALGGDTDKYIIKDNTTINTYFYLGDLAETKTSYDITTSTGSHYAYEFDVKLLNKADGAVFKIGVYNATKSAYTDMFSIAYDSRFSTEQYTLFSKGYSYYNYANATPLGYLSADETEWVHVRIETGYQKYNAYRGTLHYRVFVNGDAVCDMETFTTSSSNECSAIANSFKFTSGQKSSTGGTPMKFELDNVKFYEISDITPAPVTLLTLSYSGETGQYEDNVSAVTFTASGNMTISDTENIKWYVNDEEQSETGATFTYTPDATVGDYSVYAKYGDVASDAVTITVNEEEVLEEITVTASGDVIQFEESLSEITFTASGNIEIEDPENIAWYVDGEEKSSGESFSYTPAGNGTFVIKAVYGEITSNEVSVNVIYYTDPTEAEYTETTKVFSHIFSTSPGVSNDDPNRFNQVYPQTWGLVTDPTDSENSAMYITSTAVNKKHISPERDFHFTSRLYLPTGDGIADTAAASIYFGNISLFKATYNSESESFAITVGDTAYGSVTADSWFTIDVYLSASANSDLTTAWSYAKAKIYLTGDLKDADGNAVSQIEMANSGSVTYSNISNTYLGIKMADGTIYVDDYLITYPGSFAVSETEAQTYGEGYGMKLDGKYYVTFNRDIDFDTVSGNVSVKDEDENALNPDIYTEGADTLVIDFADERLEENSAYTIEFTDSLKDVTGRHLLEKTIEFETVTDPSDEAYLSKLAFTVNDGEDEVCVNGFNSDIHEDTVYTVLVDSGTESVTMAVAAANIASSVVIDPADGIVDLSSGSGSAIVTITSADGSKTVVHTINFTVSSTKLVESVTVTPEDLTIWADFGADLTLNATVLPAEADDLSVVWTSSDTSVAEVSMAGTLTLKNPGVTVIRATANDGSGYYDEMTLTVTEAKNRADNQKLNLDPTSTSRVDVEKYLSLPENVGDMQIAMWAGNATGAFTMTADDSISGDFATFIEWYQTYGVPTTLFVPASAYSKTSGKKMYLHWQDADAADGVTVQSHTYSHGDFNSKTTAEMAWDYLKAIEIIGSYCNDPVDVVAYASGDAGDINVARQFYIAGRGVTGTPNGGSKTNYLNTNSLSGVSTANAEKAIKVLYDDSYDFYGNTYVGGWVSVHMHALASGTPFADETLAKYKYGEDATEEQLASAEFYAKDRIIYMYEKYLVPAMKEGKVWAATFADAAKYGQERDTAVLTVKNSSVLSYTFAIADEMDDTIFTYPLTVKIKVSSNWTAASATQNGAAAAAELKEIDGEKYVFVEAVPDKGDVVVTGVTDDRTIEVSAVNGIIKATVNGGDTQDWQSLKTELAAMGTVISLTAEPEEGAEFLYWIDKDSGLILSYDESYELTVGTNRKISAVFCGADEVYVTFRNINGKIIKADIASESMTVPENPYVYGYAFDGWYLDGKKQSTLTAGALVGSVESSTMYLAGFTKVNEEFTVTYGEESKTYIYNAKAEYTADAEKDGNAFSYWERDGKIVSYDLTYSFYVNADTTLEAVYGEEAGEEVLIVMAPAVVVDTNKIAFFSERNVPEGYTVIETGILMGKNEGLTTDNAEYKAVAKNTTNNGQYTVRKANVSAGETYYGRAYVIYADENGSVKTAYSDEVSKTMN